MAHERTLAYSLFQHRVEALSSVYWNLAAATEYAKRHWNSLPKDSWPKTAQQVQGDQRDPFRRIGDIETHLKSHETCLKRILASALLDCVTAFEVYLYDATQVVITATPEVLSDLSLTLPVKDAYEKSALGVLRWAAEQVAEHLNRSKTHREFIVKVGTWVQMGFAKDDNDIEQWHAWTLLRNAIAHAWSRVTADLAAAAGARFGAVGTPLVLREKDLSEATSLAFKLAGKIDQGLWRLAGESDQECLAAELFVRHGLAASDISKMVSDITQARYKRADAERAIAKQKRGEIASTSELPGRVADVYFGTSGA